MTCYENGISDSLVAGIVLDRLGATDGRGFFRFSTAMMATIGLLAFVNFLENLGNQRRCHGSAVRFHAHVAFIKRRKSVLRLLRRQVTGKPRRRSLPIFWSPLRRAGFPGDGYGVEACGMGGSGSAVDRAYHSLAKLRDCFRG